MTQPRCHDCKNLLMEGDEFVLYNTSSGNFYKCKKCHQKDTKLRNFQPTEIYKRIVGYMSPTKRWNAGKKEEEKQRKEYNLWNTK